MRDRPIITPPAPTIGSFRNDVTDDVTSLRKILPADLFSSVFEEIPDDLEMKELISVDQSKAYLNNAAFGTSYAAVRSLSVLLRAFSEQHADVFYDQAVVPLLQYSYKITEQFLGTENVVLVPNCTYGMKSVGDHIFKTEKHSSVAFLNPVYGATEKLLDYYKETGDVDTVISIAPGGEDAILTEDPDTIVKSLETAYASQAFTVLFCDETSSQSGRILPLQSVVNWCKSHDVVLVVDGTQTCGLFVSKMKKDVLDGVDYFVMSTHKWLGNVKTCGIIRYKKTPPSPPAISFGWNEDDSTPSLKHRSSASVRSTFLWQGMMDTYIPYICLSKAIRMFQKYGQRQLEYSSRLQEEEMCSKFGMVPLLPRTSYVKRVMNIYKLESGEFRTTKDITKVQNALQEYGVHVSVKKFGQSCGRVQVESSKNNSNGNHGIISNGVMVNGNHQTSEYGDISNGHDMSNGHGNLDANGNEVIKINEDAELENVVCTSGELYLRVACWSYNKPKDVYTLQSVLRNNLPLSSTKNEALRRSFLYTFDLYERLFTTLSTDGFFVRAERLRHPLIFYYGHTATFFVNKLVLSGFIKQQQRINTKFESTFAVGVDEMSWDDLLEDNYEWSTMSKASRQHYVDEVLEYRRKVRGLVTKLIDENPVKSPITQDSLHWIILMGIEHEKIHLETSAVIVAQVPISLIKSKHNFSFPTYWKKHPEVLLTTPSQVPQNRLLPIPGGKLFMGKDHLEMDLYGWDNEFGKETKTLDSFEASEMLVSNAEYLGFVRDGGYTDSRWWSEEGWRFVQDLNVQGPRFWVGQSRYRAMLEEVNMPWSLPVVVNYLESEAFCNWKSQQLGKKVRPISYEEQFHMRQSATSTSSNSNLNHYASPTPVDLYHGDVKGTKIFDVWGNVWRNCVSVLTVMEGFKPHPVYNDFTLPCLDGKHNYVVGGSWISLGNCANANVRYAFRRHFYQYAGIRYVHSNNDYHDTVPEMFTEVALTRHITEHYSDFKDTILTEKQPVSNWPQCLAVKSIPLIKDENSSRGEAQGGGMKMMVAHGGCGRTTLEILTQCSNLNIDHTDTTANTLQVLERLLEDGTLQWHQQTEGTLTKGMQYCLQNSLTKQNLLKDKGNNINYYQTDYTNIRPQLDDYDVIVADIRHKDAADELKQMTMRLKPGGLLLLGSIDDVSNADNDNNNKHALAVLRTYYTPVNGVAVEEHPHIYSETRNKHQYAISYFSAWRKLSQPKNESGGGVVKTKEETSLTTDEYYEDESILVSYDRFHFGPGFLGVRNFLLRMAEVCMEMCRKYNVVMGSALDAGCGPGRTAIELAQYFKHVEGYDYSQSFVDMMLQKKSEGDVQNLRAYQGDSHKQNEITHAKHFDLILGCNLIDRLHTPQDWILQSKSMLTESGILIISSPYTWKPEHTDPSKYVGGFMKDAEHFSTVDGLSELLQPELQLLDEVKVPFVIPDADGTYQYTYSNCTVFGKPR